MMNKNTFQQDAYCPPQWSSRGMSVSESKECLPLGLEGCLPLGPEGVCLWVRHPPGQTPHLDRHPTWTDTPVQIPSLGRHPLGRHPPGQAPRADTPCPLHAGTHTHTHTHPPIAFWDTPPSWTEFWTHACENNTFTQLL